MCKKDELKGLFSTEDISIAAACEIKPKNGTIPTQDLLEMDGYDCFLNPAYSDLNTRGVVIYTKQELNAQLYNCSASDLFKDSVWVTVPTANQSVLVGCVYRSGTKEKAKSLDEELHNMMKYMCTQSGFKCVLIMGDFNHPGISWTPHPVITTNHRNAHHPEHLFVNTLNDCLLTQFVSSPTRDREGQNPTTDDLILSTDSDMINNVEHLGHLGASDHHILSFDMVNTFKKPTQNTRTRYKYHQANLEGFSNYMSINWETELKNSNSEEAYDKFLKKYNEAKELFVPKTKITPSQKYVKPIWMKPATLNLIRRKKHSHIKFLNTRARTDRESYKSLRNQVTSATRKDRREFERNISKEIKNNNKLFWRYINSQRISKTTIPDLKRKDGTLASDDKEKAEILNAQFTSVFTNEDTINPPTFEPLPVNTTLDRIQIKPSEVKKLLKNLRTQKSCGPDGVHPYILHHLADTMSIPLTIIFKLSLQTRKVPSIWKQGVVSALFKKGKKCLASNYRAITLTSIVCKILEKIIVTSIQKHLKINLLEDLHQHGFTINKSTITNLLEALNIWSEALSHGLPVDIIYLDFEKAFDKVPHERLIMQLSRYGITGDVKAWIKDYLTNRSQAVRVNGQYSNSTSVLSGVPQGSVLGPVLFLIFVADISSLVKNFISLYADDSKLYSYLLDQQEDVHTAESIQEDINTLSTWSRKMQMSFNPDKCVCIHMGNRNQEYDYFLPKIYSSYSNSNSTSYTLYCHPLKKVNQEKDLGVIVDSELNFKNHISQKIAKANSMIYLVKNCFHYLDKEMFKLLYKSLIRPHLEYASNVWNPIYKEEIIRLEGVQRRATKLLPEIADLPYEDRLKALELPSLYYRRLRQDLIFIYNYAHQNIKLNTDTHCKICHNTDTNMLIPNTAGTRGHPFKYRIPRQNTYRKKFITSKTLHFWNNLSAHTVTACSINTFKGRLDRDTSLPSRYKVINYGAPIISC